MTDQLCGAIEPVSIIYVERSSNKTQRKLCFMSCNLDKLDYTLFEIEISFLFSAIEAIFEVNFSNTLSSCILDRSFIQKFNI
jgi:hypothetical protein